MPFKDISIFPARALQYLSGDILTLSILYLSYFDGFYMSTLQQFTELEKMKMEGRDYLLFMSLDPGQVMTYYLLIIVRYSLPCILYYILFGMSFQNG